MSPLVQESTLLGDPVLNGYVDALSDAMTRQHAYPVCGEHI